jgi:hypothetical protein
VGGYNRRGRRSEVKDITMHDGRAAGVVSSVSLSELNGVILSELFGVGTRALFHATDHARTWSRK